MRVRVAPKTLTTLNTVALVLPTSLAYGPWHGTTDRDQGGSRP